MALMFSVFSTAFAQEIDWTRQFGSEDWDSAYGVALDGEGNVCVVGATSGTLPGQSSSGRDDAFLCKLGPLGNVLWTCQFGSDWDDSAWDVALDGEGNVYVVGWTWGTLPDQSSDGLYDAFVYKFDPLGNVLWIRQFGSDLGDEAYGVALDGEGNVYVSGYTWGTLPGQSSAGGEDAFVCKFDPLGNVLWIRQFGSDLDDGAFGVALDGEGNVYVAGYTFGTLPGQSSAGGEDAFVCKFGPLGNVLWTRQFGSDKDDWVRDVALDGEGQVYIVGATFGTLPGQNSPGEDDAFVCKFDPLGNMLWICQFGSGWRDWASGVALDGEGSVYVVGVTGGTLPGQSSAGGVDAFLCKFDPLGNLLWTRQFGPNDYDWAHGVALDGEGNVYVVGVTGGTLPGQSSAGRDDAFIGKLR